jgi:hypothetical protein
MIPRHTLLAVCVAALPVYLSVQSCTISSKVITSTDCADATNIVHDTTVWNYFWGIKQAADINPKCDPNFNYLNRVTVKTNLGHILISALTLGIAVPQKVSWCCAPPNTQPGTLGTPR